MRVTFVGEPLARVHADILVTGFFEDARPLQGFAGQIDWLAGGILSKLIVGRRVTGRLKEATLVALPTFSTPRILCVGLGKSAAYGYLTIHQVAEALLPLLGALRVGAAAVEVLGAHARGLDAAIAARTFMKAWYNGAQEPGIDVAFVVPKGAHPQQLDRRLREMGV
jgi:hypothetical protein